MDIGSVVRSNKGRDVGRVYVVYSIIDSDFVNLVNGDTRKFDNPKKKRIKHIDFVVKMPDFEGQNLLNSDIKKICKSYSFGGQNA